VKLVKTLKTENFLFFLMEFVNGLTIQETVKQEILQLRPETYTGI
jgi:hypothetical protein